MTSQESLELVLERSRDNFFYICTQLPYEKGLYEAFLKAYQEASDNYCKSFGVKQ